MNGITALYIFMLAAFAGYEVIRRVPVILHTPLMSGSNFVHGVVLVGAMIAMGEARTTLELVVAFAAVVLASANVFGGYVVTERMLGMFTSSRDCRNRQGDGGEEGRQGGAASGREDGAGSGRA